MLSKMQLRQPVGLSRPLSLRVVSVAPMARPARAGGVPAAAAPAPAAPLPLAALAAAAAPLLLAPGAAIAAGGEFGILEGRTAALVHPAVMAVLFGLTLYAGYLGFQWRRARTIGEDIKALKAQLPKAAGDGEAPAPPPALAEQIAALEKERKELISGGFRDKHFVTGSALLGFGVLIGIEGAVNTWLRTGKLFPGPHLFAGAAIVALWAGAAALVPAMQKGDENARSAHIALNALNVALFVWQLPTGFEIVGKVFEFTSWP